MIQNASELLQDIKDIEKEIQVTEVALHGLRGLLKATNQKYFNSLNIKWRYEIRRCLEDRKVVTTNDIVELIEKRYSVDLDRFARNIIRVSLNTLTREGEIIKSVEGGFPTYSISTIA